LLKRAKEGLKSLVNVRQIRGGDKEGLERELARIRRFFNENLKKNETLEIQWGTKEAFKYSVPITTTNFYEFQ